MPSNRAEVKYFRAVLTPIDDVITPKKTKIEPKETKGFRKHSKLTYLLTKLRKSKKNKKIVVKDKPMSIDDIADKTLNYAKTLKLLNYISKFPDIINWNQRNELELFQQSTPATNFLDLIHLAMNSRGLIHNTNGGLAFVESLKHINTPSHLVSNSEMKKILQKNN